MSIVIATPTGHIGSGIVERLLQAGESLTLLARSPEKLPETVRQGATVVHQGWGLLELRPMRMSLEEIFLSLTTEDAATAPDASGRARPDAELETSHE